MVKVESWDSFLKRTEQTCDSLDYKFDLPPTGPSIRENIYSKPHKLGNKKKKPRGGNNKPSSKTSQRTRPNEE